MHTQSELLDLARASVSPATYYRLAKECDWGPAYLSALTTGKAVMSADRARRIAYLTRLDEGYVLACIEAERSRRAEHHEAANAWMRVAERLGSRAAALILSGALGLITAGKPAPAQALTAVEPNLFNCGSIYYAN